MSNRTRSEVFGLKLKLISPSTATPLKPRQARRTLFPPLNLATIAALTPPDWEVTLVDESVQHHDFEEPADLVAITCMTASAIRAYEIADEYRRRGVKVVLGGIHPSAVPEEAINHADAVVVGEAEDVWTTLLEDFKKGRLRGIYKAERLLSLEGLPVPRRDLYPKGRYLVENTVQTSRGCPFNCSFCSVTRFFGNTYRIRPIPDILKEIETLKGRLVVFVDDNIIGNPSHAKKLFQALIPYRLRWVGQSSINIAKNEELLGLAAKSGCFLLFIGFESLIAENLTKIGKGVVNKANAFLEAIKRIHSHGIAIEGAFIFGFDEDDPGIFRRTVEFAKRAKLAAAQFGILTPFPGTDLQVELLNQRRITTQDWSKYTVSNVVFKPLKMTGDKLQDGLRYAYQEFYSYSSIVSRLLPRLTRDFGFLFATNMGFRQVALKALRGRIVTE